MHVMAELRQHQIETKGLNMRNVILKVFIASVVLLAVGSPSRGAPSDSEKAAHEARVAEARIQEEKHRLMVITKEREMMDEELSVTRKQLREQTGLVEVTPEAVRQMIARL